MSYSRRFHETYSDTITVHYPASERAGTITQRFTVPIEIIYNVDTLPFDRSVNNCNANINLLTGAVVATESAELISIEKNSKKVAGSIVNGFFSYIRSEISQQISELSQHIDAHLMHLKELSQACISKKTQMEGDFNRISSRYVKIFNDMNGEISNRIYDLDKPAFEFKKETDNQKIRTTSNELVNTVTIFGSESGELQSKVSASIAKKRAFDTLIKAKKFLTQQKMLNLTIKQSMINENTNAVIYTPICFLEVVNENQEMKKDVFSSQFISTLNEYDIKKMIIDKFSSTSCIWNKISKNETGNMKLYFNAEVMKSSQSEEIHSKRVKDMIQRITNIDEVSVINR